MSTQVRPEWVDRHADLVKALIEQYPVRRSALMPLLHIAQSERGHIAVEDYAAVGELIGEPAAYVESVCSFYSMYHRHPVGKFHMVVCGNISCGLCGGEQLTQRLQASLGVASGETTPDGLISLEITSECLAACDAAPVLQVNAEYFLRVTLEKAEALVAALRQGDAEAVARLAEHPEVGRRLLAGGAPPVVAPGQGDRAGVGPAAAAPVPAAADRPAAAANGAAEAIAPAAAEEEAVPAEAAEAAAPAAREADADV